MNTAHHINPRGLELKDFTSLKEAVFQIKNALLCPVTMKILFSELCRLLVLSK